MLLQLLGRTEGENEWRALLRPRLLAPEATTGLGPTCWNANKFGVVLQSVFPPFPSPTPYPPFLSLILIIKAVHAHYRKSEKM